ncbi:flagellar motor switch protein FliG [Cognatiyoonia koreensis]|uniref:Flagellar motor switch protein FliG n=1 Tax=Cognatiyoonia koreensis TaxID=364200 RepID=A0A1I0NPI5_9RHOB|nr:FliG C-terminal domain-containing protein [Cognatiyoonia koreensis]SEW03457.1 flagellar motor switch protein FliG [Cognatiyoonia koreensis]
MQQNTSTAPKTDKPVLSLSRRRKAALIVQLMIGDGGKLALSSLPEHLQELLAHELGAIRLVDRDTVNAVADEFADLLGAIGLSAPGEAGAALDALSAHLSPALAGRLRAQLGGPRNTDPWVQLAGLDVEELTPIMQSESAEVSAVILSKLPVGKAAAVLGALPGELARRITFAVSRTADIAPDTVNRIGAALVRAYCTVKVSAFEKPPVDRVGAILNSSPAATRDAMLEGLDTADEGFAKGVRKAIFTFADIPTRLVATDVPACIRGVDPDQLTLGIAAALGQPGPLQDAAEFILSNISQRMAGQMREDAAEKGTVKSSVGEEAMNAITASIRDLADSGALTLIDPDAEDDD